MATKNINTNSFTSTNNNSKEENTMKANTFTQDCTHPFTFAKVFYDAVILGYEPEFLDCWYNEDYYNHRMALYVATGDLDPDPAAEVEFEHVQKMTTWAQGIGKQLENGVETIALEELFDRVYHTVKSFKNRRLEMHFRRSYDWITTNIPTFRYTFLERIFLGAIMNDYTIALKVFCNKDRTSIEDYIDINFAPVDLDDRNELTRRADINYDLLTMTNITGMDEDDLLEIAQEKAEAGITLTFDAAYYITHPTAAALDKINCADDDDLDDDCFIIDDDCFIIDGTAFDDLELDFEF